MAKSPFVVIPFEQLSPEALSGVLEDFIGREGTDYGHGPVLTLSQKVAQVRRQLEEGRAVLVFDPERQSCNIVRKDLLTRDAKS